MRRYIIVIAIGLFLMSLITGPIFAKMGGKGKAPDMMKQGMSMRTGQGMHGLGFMHSAGNAFGEYVTFTVDDNTGNVLDYGIAGVSLFGVKIADFDYASTEELGAVTRISNVDGSTLIQLHDNPSGVINILTAESISITFTLADGVNASKEDGYVRIESGDIAGYIVSTGPVTSSVSDTEVKLDASPDSIVVFRASPVNMPMIENTYRRFSREIGRNRVGMEVAFGRNRTYNTINYSAAMNMRVQSMDRDRIRLIVNSTDPAGRLIGINLDNSSLMIGARDRLRIHYDGTSLQCVNDPNIVFNGTDRPLCWISDIQERTRARVMIHVPNFSERTIDIVVEPEEPEATENITVAPTETPEASGFGYFASMVAVVSLAFYWRRRN